MIGRGRVRVILLFLPFHGRSGGIISGLEGLSDESHTHIKAKRT